MLRVRIKLFHRFVGTAFFVCTPALGLQVEQMLGKAGLKPEHVVEQVKEAVCKSPEAAATFDGITLSGGAGISKGIFNFGGELEFGLFFDRVHRRILGHVFIVPKAAIAKPGSGKPEIQIGAMFGCKGDPHNYLGYFASVSAFGLGLNLGVGDGVFNRLGSYMAGVDLNENAPMKVDTAFSQAESSQSILSAGASSFGSETFDKVSMGQSLAGMRHFQFRTTKNGTAVEEPLSKSATDFEQYVQSSRSRVRTLLEGTKNYRKYLEQLKDIPETRRQLSTPIVEAEYRALDVEITDHVERLQRFSMRFRKYQANKALHDRIFDKNRFQLDSVGGLLGLGGKTFYKDKVTGERLTEDEHHTRKGRIQLISSMIDAANDQIIALRNIRSVLTSDRANFTQGQAFVKDQSVGGLKNNMEILSGCNSITMNPKVFMESGGPLLMAMAEYNLRLNAKHLMNLQQVKSHVLRPEHLDKFRKATKSASHHMDPNVSLSYYYTPEEIEKVFGIPMTDLTGKLEFEVPVPESLKDIFLGKDDLCGKAHGNSHGTSSPSH